MDSARASDYIHVTPRAIKRLRSTRRTHMNTHASESEALLTPAEVAAMFRVDPKTVTRWAKAGKLSSIRTLGGHRRYRESEVRALLSGMVPEQRQPGSDD
jgi:excisionase family DNA binding protein